MTKMFCYDIETLSIESTAVVLSAAIVWFDPAEVLSYEELVERSLYVKFSAKEQHDMGRTISKDTLEWWKKQGSDIRKLCFTPSTKDLSAKDGLEKLRAYIGLHGTKNSFMWARGSLDQLVTESLCRSANVETLISYNMWMDVRTAIRMTKESSTISGYCDVPGFDRSIVDKHNPVADIVFDIIMLTQGT